MNTKNLRNYNCKDEELPIICNYLGFSFKRDLAEFTAFSPKIDSNYLTEFMNKTAATMEIVDPKSETVERKSITEKLYAAIALLQSNVSQLQGYLKLAKKSVPISVTDFGITPLRLAINKKDAESIIKNAHSLNANIVKYKTQLTEVGFSENFFNSFLEVTETINLLNQKQYESMVQRRNLVQSNIALFTELYEQFSEICTIGKILFKVKDPVKVREYTFTDLLKKVRLVHKNKTDETMKAAKP